MTILLFGLPLALILVGWLVGALRLRYIFVFLLAWVPSCFALYALGMIMLASRAFSTHPDPSPLALVLVSIVLLMFSLWMAFLFGGAVSTQDSPAPIEHIAKAYDDLEPHHKELAKKAVLASAPIAMRHFGEHLVRKGYVSTGGFLRDAGKVLG